MKRLSKILVVYHFQSGNTEKMAKTFAEVPRASRALMLSLRRHLMQPWQTFWDAMLLVLDRQITSVTSQERSRISSIAPSIPSQGKVAGKPYAAFATGGRGGETALAVLDRLCGSFKLKKAVDSVSVAGAPSSEILMACSEAGKKLAIAATKC